MRIAISADSTSSISQKEAKKLGVFILPLNVIVDGIEYHDDIDINHDKLKNMMRGGSRITTSTPTISEIESFFDNIFALGYEKVIHFTLSSKLSSMYSLFVLTCKEKYGDKVEVIDTLSACSFMGNLVKRAKKFADNNKSIENIIELIKKDINQDEIYLIPESLTFLKNGGRVSPSVAAIGNLIGIKPILKLADGEIVKSGTTRTYKRAYLDTLEAIKNNYKKDEHEIHIIEFDAQKVADELVNDVEKLFPEYKIKRSLISINVCAHTGPGTIGFGFCKKV